MGSADQRASAYSADGESHAEVTRAIGSLICRDGERVLAVASRYRTPPQTIESTVQGWSMRDAIPDGSRIRIKLNEPGTEKVGDVVAFLVGTRVVVHRVVYCGRRQPAVGHLLTRGDARIVPDPPLAKAHLLGTVTGIAGGDGWVQVGPRQRYSAVRELVVTLVAVAVSRVLESDPGFARALAAYSSRVEGLLRLLVARMRSVGLG
jgi:hypothetical protein